MSEEDAIVKQLVHTYTFMSAALQSAARDLSDDSFTSKSRQKELTVSRDLIRQHTGQAVYLIGTSNRHALSNCRTRAASEASVLHKAYVLSVTAHTAVLVNALPRLQALLSKDSDGLQICEFSLAWDIVTCAGLFQCVWPKNWPGINMSYKLARYTAVNDLVKWQLAFTRGSSSLWKATKLAHSHAMLKRRMLETITAALTAIDHILFLEGNASSIALSQLPSEFISNICCLAIEQLGPDVRRRHAHTCVLPLSGEQVADGERFGQFFCQITVMIGNCLIGDQATSNLNRLVDASLCPALFEAAKLALLYSVTPAVSPSPMESKEDWRKERVMGGSYALNIICRTLQVERYAHLVTVEEKDYGAVDGFAQNVYAQKLGSSSFHKDCIPRVTTSDLQTLNLLRECSHQSPIVALITMRLLLQVVVARCMADQTPSSLPKATSRSSSGTCFDTVATGQHAHLPCLLSALLCASRHVEAWMLKQVPAGKLAGNPKSKTHPRAIILQGQQHMEVARGVVEELLPLLHQGLKSEPPSSNDPSFLAACEWILMRGSVSTLEALLRDKHGPLAFEHVPNSLLAVSHYLLAMLAASAQTNCSPDLPLATAFTSLAGTTRKLFNVKLLMHDPPNDTQAGRDRCFKDLRSCRQGLLEVVRKLGASAGIQPLSPAGKTWNSAAGFVDRDASNQGNMSRASAPNAHSGSNTSRFRAKKMSSVNSRKAGTRAVTGDEALCTTEMSRLKTVLLLTLSQTQDIQTMIGEVCSPAVVDVNEIDVELTEMLDLLQEVLTPVTLGTEIIHGEGGSRLQTIRAWEEIARMQFHGRLLPGCCNQDCVNMAGVSEAALPTRLCGGCRRVRYCCIDCQKNAWLEEGHGLVCGKTGWIPS